MNKPVRTSLYALLLSFCCLAWTAPGFSQPVVSDIEGGADLGFLDRYRDSGIVRYEQNDRSDFLFALARVRKLNNRWQAEQERRVYGAYTSITYRMPDRTPVQSVFAHFSEQIQAAGFVDAFDCSGRSCGNSNKWANVIYGEKRLYGPDVHQRYRVTEKQGQTLALYVIKRGNKRVYARLDYVAASQNSTEAPEQRNWPEQLQENGRVSAAVDSDSLLQGSVELSQLVDWLTRHGTNIHLVGHAYGQKDMSALKSRSLQSATLLRDRLIAMGANAALIEVHGLGPLAPSTYSGATPEQDRLEILLIK